MKTTGRQKIYIIACNEWRQWLEENHQTEESVWVICNTKNQICLWSAGVIWLIKHCVLAG